jgi:hypothetical protein
VRLFWSEQNPPELQPIPRAEGAVAPRFARSGAAGESRPGVTALGRLWMDSLLRGPQRPGGDPKVPWLREICPLPSWSSRSLQKSRTRIKRCRTSRSVGSVHGESRGFRVHENAELCGRLLPTHAKERSAAARIETTSAARSSKVGSDMLPRLGHRVRESQ